MARPDDGSLEPPTPTENVGVSDGNAFAYTFCLSVDVQGYSPNNDVRQGQIQEELLDVLDEAGDRSGIARAEWARQSKGDEELSLIRPDLAATKVIDGFCVELAAVLHEHNARSGQRPMRLRLAIDAGPTALAVNGFAGRAVVGASRLVGADPLKRTLTIEGRADLVVMLSNSVFQDWVLGGHCSVDENCFRRVFVSEKEYTGDAWIWVPRPDRLPDQDAGWEFLLLADAMRRRLDRLTTKQFDHDMRYSRTSPTHVADPDIAGFLSRSLNRLAAITGQLTDLFTPDSVARAVGRPGEPGDHSLITQLGDRFASTYEELLDWAAGIRGTVVAPSARPVLVALAKLADEPVQAVRRFIDDLQAAAEGIAGHYRSGGDGHEVVDLSLTLGIDRDLLAFVSAERDRLGSR